MLGRIPWHSFFGDLFGFFGVEKRISLCSTHIESTEGWMEREREKGVVVVDGVFFDDGEQPLHFSTPIFLSILLGSFSPWRWRGFIKAMMRANLMRQCDYWYLWSDGRVWGLSPGTWWSLLCFGTPHRKIGASKYDQSSHERWAFVTWTKASKKKKKKAEKESGSMVYLYWKANVFKTYTHPMSVYGWLVPILQLQGIFFPFKPPFRVRLCGPFLDSWTFSLSFSIIQFTNCRRQLIHLGNSIFVCVSVCYCSLGCRTSRSRRPFPHPPQWWRRWWVWDLFTIPWWANWSVPLVVGLPRGYSP